MTNAAARTAPIDGNLVALIDFIIDRRTRENRKHATNKRSSHRIEIQQAQTAIGMFSSIQVDILSAEESAAIGETDVIISSDLILHQRIGTRNSTGSCFCIGIGIEFHIIGRGKGQVFARFDNLGVAVIQGDTAFIGNGIIHSGFCTAAGSDIVHIATNHQIFHIVGDEFHITQRRQIGIFQIHMGFGRNGVIDMSGIYRERCVIAGQDHLFKSIATIHGGLVFCIKEQIPSGADESIVHVDIGLVVNLVFCASCTAPCDRGSETIGFQIVGVLPDGPNLYGILGYDISFHIHLRGAFGGIFYFCQEWGNRRNSRRGTAGRSRHGIRIGGIGIELVHHQSGVSFISCVDGGGHFRIGVVLGQVISYGNATDANGENIRLSGRCIGCTHLQISINRLILIICIVKCNCPQFYICCHAIVGSSFIDSHSRSCHVDSSRHSLHIRFSNCRDLCLWRSEMILFSHMDRSAPAGSRIDNFASGFDAAHADIGFCFRRNGWSVFRLHLYRGSSQFVFFCIFRIGSQIDSYTAGVFAIQNETSRIDTINIDIEGFIFHLHCIGCTNGQFFFRIVYGQRTSIDGNLIFAAVFHIGCGVSIASATETTLSRVALDGAIGGGMDAYVLSFYGGIGKRHTHGIFYIGAVRSDSHIQSTHTGLFDRNICIGGGFGMDIHIAGGFQSAVCYSGLDTCFTSISFIDGSSSFLDSAIVRLGTFCLLVHARQGFIDIVLEIRSAIRNIFSFPTSVIAVRILQRRAHIGIHHIGIHTENPYAGTDHGGLDIPFFISTDGNGSCLDGRIRNSRTGTGIDIHSSFAYGYAQ